MKTKIRNTRFTLGIMLFLLIIFVLSVVSAFYLNRLSEKNSAILKENHYSVVYARDMAKNLTLINQEITKLMLVKKTPDTVMLNNELKQFSNSLKLELNNITEMGEENLAHTIASNFKEYRDSVLSFEKLPGSTYTVFYLQMKFNVIYQQLVELSEMNARAIVEKTNDAKAYARKTAIQMSFIGALCFLVAFGFTFSFTSYFNDRFYQLYNGIKQLSASNYKMPIIVEGKDEIYEISIIVNQMVEKLGGKNIENESILVQGLNKESNFDDVVELKEILVRMRDMEIQASSLITKLENQ